MWSVPAAGLLWHPQLSGGSEANAKAAVYQSSKSLGILKHESVSLVEYLSSCLILAQNQGLLYTQPPPL